MALSGGEAVRRADFGAQGKAEAVHVADDGVAGLQLAQALKEVGAHLAHAGFVVLFRQHPHGFEGHRRAEGVAGKGRVRGAAGERLRIDIPFLGPDAREGVQAVVMALPKTTTSGVMPKFWRPQSLPVR